MASNTQASIAKSGALNFDLENSGEFEEYMYGGKAATYFIRELRKCAFFSKFDYDITPNIMAGKTAAFGGSLMIQMPRNADYMLDLNISLEIPEIRLSEHNQFGANGRIRWVPNLMHNLVQEIAVMAGDEVITTVNSAFMDMWSEFMIEEGKYEGYRRMIGMTSRQRSAADGRSIPKGRFVLPAPLFTSRDSGNALPLLMLPHMDLYVKITFAPWASLVMLEDGSKATPSLTTPTAEDFELPPRINNFNASGTFSVVTQFERLRVGCMPREMVLERPVVAVAAMDTVMSTEQPTLSVSINAPRAPIKALMFGLRNTTFPNSPSNYCVGLPHYKGGIRTNEGFDGEPLSKIGILYNNITRVAPATSEHFSMVEPFRRANRIPFDKGLYLYSFALDMNEVDPIGSSNPSNNDARINFQITGSEALMNSAQNQKYALTCVAICHQRLSVREGKISMTPKLVG